MLLLADVFEAFRAMCHTKYGIGPAHSFTAPSFSWQAALRMTKVKLELLSDHDMHLFVENAIRGGVSTISHRFARANVPGTDGYDETKPPSRLIYWDANNLYGYSMSQYLPVRAFKWMEQLRLKKVNEDVQNGDMGFVMNMLDDALKGAFLK